MNEERWIVYNNNMICKIWNSYKLRGKKRFVMEPTTTQSYQQEH